MSRAWAATLALLLVGCSSGEPFGDGDTDGSDASAAEGDCDEWADAFWTATQEIESEREECSALCPGAQGECDWSECDWLCSGDYWFAKSELMMGGEGCVDFAEAYVAYDLCHSDAFYAAAAELSETESCTDDDVPGIEDALEAERDACTLSG